MSLNNLSKHQIESLNMLGYFQSTPTADFVCGLVGCNSKVKISDSGTYFFVTSATNTMSISPKPSFELLVDSILDFQYSNAPYEYFEYKEKGTGPLWNTEKSVLCSTYVLAKSNKKSSRDFSKNLVRVKSSNIWSYGYNAEIGKKSADMYIQFKGKNGGPGDIYLYFDVPLQVWKKFITAPSKGHFFWKHVRNNFRYRKLTGDKKGKLPNAIN